MTPRRLLAPVVLGSLAVTCAAPPPGDGLVGSSVQPIVYGTLDTTHSAVVALLGGDSQTITECSGTIVQVQNGTGTVLTAAHCCTPTAAVDPQLVVLSSDYASAMSYLEGGGPLPANTYPVLAGSVQADPAYDSSASAPIDDFCMLQVAGLPDGVASIPVATCADGLVLGEQVEYVGFGATQTNPNNTARRHGDSTIDEALTSQWFQYSEGDGRSGPCQGDDGGPAVLPAGAPQSTQVVVGTTSYGDLSCNSYGVSMRVSSATCAGGFIAEYLSSGPADAGTDASGVDAGNEAGTADAGTDASRGDAGNEAGTADAGVDASVVDAAADAGAPDAGTPEAAATDSGEDAPAVEAGGEDAGADVGSEDAGEIDAGAEAGLVDATTDAQGAQEAGAPDAVTVQDAQSDGGSSVASDAARPTDARTVSDAGHSGQDARATGTDSGPRRDAARRDSGDAETDAGEASGAGEGGGGCSVSRRPVGHGLAQGLGLGLALLLACGRRRRDGGSGHPSREA